MNKIDASNLPNYEKGVEIVEAAWARGGLDGVVKAFQHQLTQLGVARSLPSKRVRFDTIAGTITGATVTEEPGLASVMGVLVGMLGKTLGWMAFYKEQFDAAELQNIQDARDE